jgi:hypothetical protein
MVSAAEPLESLVEDLAARTNLNAAAAQFADPRVAERKRRLRLRALRQAPVPTSDEISALKAAQHEKAAHEETRRILEAAPPA